MTDKDIISYFKNITVHNWNNIPEEYKIYLNNRFSDSESIKESYWRILNNIEIRPVCHICGSKVKFIGKSNNVFSKTCSKECTSKLKHKLFTGYRYNDEQKHSIREKTKKTLFDRYGDEHFNNRNKAKETCLKKYGVTSYAKTNECKEKTKNTMLQKYSVEYASQLDTNIFKTNNPQKDPSIKEKTKQTRLDKYGKYMSDNNVLKLYSVEVNEKRHESFINTMLDKYGNINYRNLEKHKKTCIERYGVDSYSKTQEFKDKLNENMKEIFVKRFMTRKQNHTFNTSTPEIESYELLKQKYPNTISQYKSEQYPFVCDFYIPEIDTYIECNYHWTHGKKPYTGSEEDRQILEKWKAKNTKYYDNAINTWTIRDVKKINTFIKNNLNFKLFYNINELKNWLGYDIRQNLE